MSSGFRKKERAWKAKRAAERKAKEGVTVGVMLLSVIGIADVVRGVRNDTHERRDRGTVDAVG